MKMLLHSFVFCLILGQVQSWGGAFTCEDYYTDGTYCTDDYSGYHVCTWTGGWGQRYNQTTFPCPQGTRCTCHYRYQCSMEIADICQPFSTPKPFVDPALFTYTGRRVHDYVARWREDVITELKGEIRQDVKNGKMLTIGKRTCKGKSSTYFNLNLPKPNGGRVIYTGNMESRKCRWWGYGGSYKPEVRYLGYDINMYSLLKTWRDPASNRTREKWYFKKGDYEGQYFDHFWEVEVKDGLSVPVKFTENFLASEDNTHTVLKNIHYNVTVPEVGESTDRWFKVPDFC